MDKGGAVRRGGGSDRMALPLEETRCSAKYLPSSAVVAPSLWVHTSSSRSEDSGGRSQGLFSRTRSFEEAGTAVRPACRCWSALRDVPAVHLPRCPPTIIIVTLPCRVSHLLHKPAGAAIAFHLLPDGGSFGREGGIDNARDGVQVLYLPTVQKVR